MKAHILKGEGDEGASDRASDRASDEGAEGHNQAGEGDSRDSSGDSFLTFLIVKLCFAIFEMVSLVPDFTFRSFTGAKSFSPNALSDPKKHS